MPETLRIGQPVKVEGPYGCFTFDDERPRQIWIGGGIGITPFIARVKDLAMQRQTVPGRPPSQAIDLFHTTTDYRAAVPHWREASVWCCGPPGFGTALRDDFARHDLPVAGRFHQELFAMR